MRTLILAISLSLAFAPAAWAKGGIKIDKKGVKIKGKKGGMKIDKKGLDIH